jgi:membrane protein required for colicin V production
MTWVDGVVLAVLAISAVVAFSRGLVQEVLGVGAWVGAALVALLLRPHLAPPLVDSVGEPWVADAIVLVCVFLLVLVLLKLAIAAVARRVQQSVLGSTDRALGLVFGLARGAFLAVLAYILGGMIPTPAERWPEAVREARSLPLVAAGAHWLVDMLPPDYRPPLAASPGQPGPTMDDLLRPPARNRT